MKRNCENLDAYLADDLSADATTRFARHLDHCAACREAVDEQRWIDGLLRSDAIASLEPAPTALRETLHTSIARRRQSTRLIACSVLSLSKGGLATAATLAIVALGWTLKLNRQADDTHVQGVNDTASYVDPRNTELIPTLANEVSPSPATFVSNGDNIALHVESADDDVTIVQLYLTTDAERRMRRELSLRSPMRELNGG